MIHFEPSFKPGAINPFLKSFVLNLSVFHDGLYLIGQYIINTIVSILLIMVSIVFRWSVEIIIGQYILLSI